MLLSLVVVVGFAVIAELLARLIYGTGGPAEHRLIDRLTKANEAQGQRTSSLECSAY
jgi:hypothetical protein